MALIYAHNIHKYYKFGAGKLHVLKGISLTVKKGEFVAIMGPSGSGKSTLMHILGLLDRFDKGTLIINNQDVSKLKDSELANYRGKTIGFVFQNFYLLSKYSVLDNVMLPAEYIKIPNAKARARKLLKILGLADKENSKPNQLSGGQRQRVAIARALLADPEIIMADEPTGNLDSKTGHQIMELFDRLNKQGKTILLITHDPNIAKWAKRTVKIKDGKLYEAT